MNTQTDLSLFEANETLERIDNAEPQVFCLTTNYLDGRGDTLQLMIQPLDNHRALFTDDSVIVNEMIMKGLNHSQMVKLVNKIDRGGNVSLMDDLQLGLVADDGFAGLAKARKELLTTMLAILHQIGEL